MDVNGNKIRPIKIFRASSFDLVITSDRHDDGRLDPMCFTNR